MDRAFLTAPIDTLLLGDPVAPSRIVADADLDALAQLYVVARPASSIAEARDDLSAYLGGMFGEPIRALWLGVFEGQSVPISAILFSYWHGTAVIVELLTDPAYRNRGYASSIVRECALALKETDATEVGVLVERDSPSMFLLEELGFVEALAPVPTA